MPDPLLRKKSKWDRIEIGLFLKHYKVGTKIENWQKNAVPQ